MEKSKCFKGYMGLKQLNQDRSTTNILQVSFVNANEEYWNVFIENCELGEYDYYLIHSIDIVKDEIVTKTIKPTAKPQGVEFFEIE